MKKAEIRTVRMWKKPQTLFNFDPAQQLDYNGLVAAHPNDIPIIDEIIYTLRDVLNNGFGSFKIGGVMVGIEQIKERFSYLTRCHVESILERLHHIKSTIKNIGAYLMTCLYRIVDEDRFLPPFALT